MKIVEKIKKNVKLKCQKYENCETKEKIAMKK
jgi:hypothetical protein